MIKKILKWLLIGLVAMLATFAIINFKWVKYGMIQLQGQLKINRNTIPLKEYRSKVNDSTIHLSIDLIPEIIAYAVDSLGLKATKGYKTVYDQGKNELMWVVTGMKPFAMEPKQWKVPLVGKFNYLGYFREDLARRLEAEVQKAGYETRIRNAGAWSTLGWLKDPIYSNMLKRSPGALAEVIIHEMTHATIFVKDSVNYNENLASFIGKKGAEMFLAHYFDDTTVVNDYKRNEADQRKFRNHMVEGYQKLDSLYKTFTPDMDSVRKSEVKYQMIMKIMHGLNDVDFSNPEKFRYSSDRPLPNNAFFYSFKRYFGEGNEIEYEFRHNFGSDMDAFIAEKKKQFKTIQWW